MRAILGFLFATLALNLQAQTCNSAIPQTTPSSRFQVSNGEVFDTKTGLIWRQCEAGRSGVNCSESEAYSTTWAGALRTAESIAQNDGKPWRLPTTKELDSIIEEQCESPSLNLAVFPNASSGLLWSSSPHNRSSVDNLIWHAYVSYGITGACVRSTSYTGGWRKFRLVRDQL